MLRGFKAGVINGDAPSGRVFLRAIEMRAKLLGLLAPANVRPEDEIPAAVLSDREIADRVAALVHFSENGVPGWKPGWKPRMQ